MTNHSPSPGTRGGYPPLPMNPVRGAMGAPPQMPYRNAPATLSQPHTHTPQTTTFNPAQQQTMMTPVTPSQQRRPASVSSTAASPSMPAGIGYRRPLLPGGIGGGGSILAQAGIGSAAASSSMATSSPSKFVPSPSGVGAPYSTSRPSQQRALNFSSSSSKPQHASSTSSSAPHSSSSSSSRRAGALTGVFSKPKPKQPPQGVSHVHPTSSDNASSKSSHSAQTSQASSSSTSAPRKTAPHVRHPDANNTQAANVSGTAADDTGEGEAVEEYEIERIVDQKTMEDGSTEYFVKWENFSESENSWEPADAIPAEIIEEFKSSRPT